MQVIFMLHNGSFIIHIYHYLLQCFVKKNPVCIVALLYFKNGVLCYPVSLK